MDEKTDSLIKRAEDAEHKLARLENNFWVRLGAWLGVLKLHPDHIRASESSKLKIRSISISSVAIAISVVQSLLLSITTPFGWLQATGVLLASITVFFSIRFLQTHQISHLTIVFELYCCQLILFIFQLFVPGFSGVPRLLNVAATLFHGAIVSSLLLTVLGILRPARAVMLTFSSAFALFICEIALGILPLNSVQPSAQMRWLPFMKSHPHLGLIFPANSSIHMNYNDDVAGYYEDLDPRERKYRLRLAGRSQASMILASDVSEMVRIEIKRNDPNVASDIQLNLPLLKVHAGRQYGIEFQARSDQPRKIIVGFARAHEPWTGLGFYKQIDLKPKWQKFQEVFTATANYDNARIHFDLGENLSSVEISSVVLRSMDDGSTIVSTAAGQKYSVPYRFNSMGCRGRDYVVPRPLESERILFLGDSQTFGDGCYEENTVPSRLERLLNENKANRSFNYEVINCGVVGFGTKQETLFYDLFGKKYEPNLVFLVMNWNDHISYTEAVQEQYIGRIPDRLELLFRTWAMFLALRHRPPFPDYSKVANEVLRLNESIRTQGSQFAVILFRDADDYEGNTLTGKAWNQLTRTLVQHFDGKQVPILDLGRTLGEYPPTHSSDDIQRIAADEILKFVMDQRLLNQ